MLNFKNVTDTVLKNVNEVTDKVTDKVKDLGEDTKKVAKKATHNLEDFVKHNTHK